MTNKTKKTIYTLVEFLLILCMFVPFIYTHIYTRKTGFTLKYSALIMMGTVLVCIFLMWAVEKLLGVDALFKKTSFKPNWVNYIHMFIRIFTLTYANSLSDRTALYARVNMIDKNEAIQKIYTLWSIAFVIILISTLMENRYDKKRETTNENSSND